MAAPQQGGGGAMDQAIFHLINERWTSPALDLFMATVSDVNIWKPVLVAAVLYALIFGRFKGRAFLLCLGATLLLSDALVLPLLKSAVGRLRPKQTQVVRMVQLQPATPKFLTILKKPTIRYSQDPRGTKAGQSFPSGHVTDNVAIAICCAVFFRPWGWLYFLFAGAVAYSRVYLGAHWPSDVIGTVFLAAGETLLVLALLEWLWRRALPRWAPEFFARHPTLIGLHPARAANEVVAKPEPAFVSHR